MKLHCTPAEIISYGGDLKCIDTYTRLYFQVFLNIGGQDSIINLPTDASESASAKGFIAYGTHDFGIADFDNFKVENPSSLLAQENGFRQVKYMSDEFQRL